MSSFSEQEKNHMNKTLRNLLLVGFAVYAFGSLAKKEVSNIGNNIVAGTPSVRSFSVLYNNVIFQITSIGDFTQSMLEIGQDVGSDLLSNLLNFNFSNLVPEIDFRFDLDLPITNNNSFDLPNTSWVGNMSLDGNDIGAVSYPLTNLPANQTTNLNTLVTANLKGSAKLIKRLIQTKGSIISKGLNFTGVLKTDLFPDAPWNFNTPIV